MTIGEFQIAPNKAFSETQPLSKDIHSGSGDQKGIRTGKKR